MKCHVLGCEQPEVISAPREESTKMTSGFSGGPVLVNIFQRGFCSVTPPRWTQRATHRMVRSNKENQNSLTPSFFYILAWSQTGTCYTQAGCELSRLQKEHRPFLSVTAQISLILRAKCGQQKCHTLVSVPLSYPLKILSRPCNMLS